MVVTKKKLPVVAEKRAPTKRKASEAVEAIDDEGETKRFKEVVKKQMAHEDPQTKRQGRIDREKDNAKTRGVVYIGHIPHGFYEDEIRGYFSQFGEVTRVRVSRSKKTGGSRGYAFVEFLHDSVAEVAAETMNGYLMFDRILQCKVVPKEKVHPDMFAMRYPFILNREITRTFLCMERTEKREKKNRKSKKLRLRKQMKLLENSGIKLDVQVVGDGTASTPALPPQTKDPKNSKKRKSATVSESEHSFVVDEDDDEVQFKTPPNSRKVAKKSLIQTPKDKKKTPAKKPATKIPKMTKGKKA